jgi:serine protease AprX
MLRTLAHAARSIALCAAALLLNAAPAAAQSAKIATDLQAVLSAGTTPVINWARDVNGVRYVKVLIVSNADDAELSNLRKAVMAAGGSIYYRYSSVLALAALLPAGKVAAIAARSDVQSISPNRLMTRSASTLESITGAARGARHRQHQLQPADRLHRSWHRHRVPRLGPVVAARQLPR